MGGFHPSQSHLDGIHPPFNWVWNDHSERMSESNFQNYELHAFGLVLSDMSTWVLSNLSPVEWSPVGSGNSQEIEFLDFSVTVKNCEPDSSYLSELDGIIYVLPEIPPNGTFVTIYPSFQQKESNTHGVVPSGDDVIINFGTSVELGSSGGKVTFIYWDAVWYPILLSNSVYSLLSGDELLPGGIYDFNISSSGISKTASLPEYFDCFVDVYISHLASGKTVTIEAADEIFYSGSNHSNIVFDDSDEGKLFRFLKSSITQFWQVYEIGTQL